MVPAEEALAIGLIDACVERGALMEEAAALADRLANGAGPSRKGAMHG
jgi:enoyl-CoA hydratase/carnithine racemase